MEARRRRNWLLESASDQSSRSAASLRTTASRPTFQSFQLARCCPKSCYSHETEVTAQRGTSLATATSECLIGTLLVQPRSSNGMHAHPSAIITCQAVQLGCAKTRSKPRLTRATSLATKISVAVLICSRLLAATPIAASRLARRVDRWHPTVSCMAGVANDSTSSLTCLPVSEILTFEPSRAVVNFWTSSRTRALIGLGSEQK